MANDKRSSARLHLATLLLLQKPLHSPPDPLIQTDQRLISEPLLCLGNIVITRHTAVDDSLAIESRWFADDGMKDLAEQTKKNANTSR